MDFDWPEAKPCEYPWQDYRTRKDRRTTRRKIGGIFEAIRTRFADISQADLFAVVDTIYRFRNVYVAHQDRELSDPELAKQH